jgi:hypothetical protein
VPAPAWGVADAMSTVLAAARFADARGVEPFRISPNHAEECKLAA